MEVFNNLVWASTTRESLKLSASLPGTWCKKQPNVREACRDGLARSFLDNLFLHCIKCLHLWFCALQLPNSRILKMSVGAPDTVYLHFQKGHPKVYWYSRTGLVKPGLARKLFTILYLPSMVPRTRLQLVCLPHPKKWSPLFPPDEVIECCRQS